jgi:hypothetical protein
MPKQKRKESDIQSALAALLRALKATGAPHMLIGGMAVIGHGYERTTRDIDATVRADATPLNRLVELLQKQKIFPRTDDFDELARQNFILLLEHRPSRTPIDLSLSWVDFEQAACGRAVIVNFGRVRAPIVSLADLLILKGVAWRARDQNDFVELYGRHQARIHLGEILRQVEVICELLDEPGRSRDILKLIER